MTAFKFNAEHFDQIFDTLFEGYAVTLVKENKACLTIEMDNADEFSLTLATPAGIELHAYHVFSYGALFDFLDGITFIDMIHHDA